jgi:tyrosinase
MPNEPFIRHEVSSTDGEEALAAYSRAVGRMQEREATDPTSWSYQAAMHGSRITPPMALWNECRHWSWWFLTWHRLYLYYFERIVRASVEANENRTDWALPYWNYGLGGDHAKLPEPFRTPTAGNPLFVAQRENGFNGGAKLDRRIISPAKALACPRFIGADQFGGPIGSVEPKFRNAPGELEKTPHNAVHSTIGGWMGKPKTAAQDPIFWLHHANIDRVWVEWSEVAGHADPSEEEWLKHEFEFFEEEGEAIALEPGEALDTVEDLDYAYDVTAPTPHEVEPGPEPLPTEEPPKVVAANAEGMTLRGGQASIGIAIEAQAEPDLLAATSETEPQRLLLNIEELRGQENPSTSYGVFVNLPEGAGEETMDEHYVGTASFFGIEDLSEPGEEDHADSLTLTYQIGEVLRELNGGEPWSGESLDVTLVPLPAIPPEDADETVLAETEPSEDDPPVEVGRVSLSVV